MRCGCLQQHKGMQLPRNTNHHFVIKFHKHTEMCRNKDKQAGDIKQITAKGFSILI